MSEFHNLDIHMYSLDELLELFGLNYDLTIQDLKKAKKKVVSVHPDKSQLDAKYFLFYKKAYEIIVQFYENQNKHKKTLINDEVYDPGSQGGLNDSTDKEIFKTINNMSKASFQSKFNKMFEENNNNKPDPTKNEWFTNENNQYEITEKVNTKNMGYALEKIKEKQNTIVKYNGVESLYVNSDSGNKLYEDDDNGYVTTDPFGKLKFDDLRKVHKDQTVLMVSEKDIRNIPQYSSVDQYNRARGAQKISPLDKKEAEKILSQQNETYKQQIMQKEYESKLQVLKNEEKNKNILSKFLYLKNN
tara:strand:+ start:18161 stop:19066 length:906 start_codon:yes stop_codon:yes gene_type:complete